MGFIITRSKTKRIIFVKKNPTKNKYIVLDFLVLPTFFRTCWVDHSRFTMIAKRLLFVRTFRLDRKLPSTWTEKNFHNDIKFPGNISIGQSHDEKQFNFKIRKRSTDKWSFRKATRIKATKNIQSNWIQQTR